MNNESHFKKFLNECIRKDKRSWDRFVDRFGNLIYFYIIHTFKRYNYSIKNKEADEIFNDVFLALLQDDCKKIKAFKGDNERSFMVYLRAITFHMVVDFLRAQKRFIGLDKVEFCSTRSKIDRFEINEFRRLVSMLRDGLPARHNYLFMLLYEEGLNHLEIAQLMSLTPNAVHQLKFRMLRNIEKIARKKRLYNELKHFMRSSTNFQLNRASMICVSESS